MRLILVLLVMQGVAQATVWDIVTRLRHVECEEICVDVSPAVAADLTALKHALRDLISETVRADGAASPGELQARVIARLEREDVPVGDVGGYGVILSIQIVRPKEYAEWLIATTTLGLPYEGDTSLYVYRARAGSWQLALSLEANGYDSIRGAQGGFDYRVGVSAHRAPYLVTAAVNPSSVSVWRRLTLRVLEAGARPDSPVQLVSRTLTYCLEEPYQIAIHSGGFALLYEGDAADMRFAGYPGIHYIEYSIDHGRATVVKEAAADPGRLVKGFIGVSRLVLRELSGREELFAVSGNDNGIYQSPSRYAVIHPNLRGIRVVSVSTKRPDWLPDSSPSWVLYSGVNGIAEPEVMSRVVPALPAGYSGAQRKVRVSLVVRADGSVDYISTEWPDQPGLVIPAIRAVRQWKFKPVTSQDGQPINATKTVDVVFQN